MPSPPIRELQFISLRDENIMSLTETNIYNENLDPLAIKLLCKYRKSCYKNGKVPLTKVSKKAQNFQEKKEDHKPLEIRCKYRKSCYKTGILPSYLNHTVYVVATSIKQYEDPQLKCKHRKSCYENMELDIQLDKEGVVKPPYQTEPVIKYKEKEQKDEVLEEVTNEKVDELARRKLKSLNLRLKNRKKRQLSIKDFRRANGAICNIYYISCRKQAGLPILVRAPIGPNGRRLCRKKKKEDITN
ncbi:hypothetical protein DINM_002289 [Dirofilaria immitis]|nr:hypothetical protein [Dirofilaria immitis]